MKKNWWKIVSVALLVYTFIAGFLGTVPRLPLLQETIRNLYFHVCMWFAMMILFTVSVVNAIKYLRTLDSKYDVYTRQYAVSGILFGILGYATGAIWASYTWADPNKPLVNSFSTIARDPKLIGAAIALLVYFAYLILRDSITDLDKRARISAVYNIFAYAILFPAIWILPRILPSLHPGNDGNPALDVKNDISSDMRVVFYPAILGWTLLGVWITSLKIRLQLLQKKIERMKFLKTFLAIILLAFTSSVEAQPTRTPMAELMRSDGRIYVVIAVLLTILAGLVIYLIRLDKRITRLEKEN